MKSLNDIIWNGDLDLEEGNDNIQFGDNPSDPRLEQSCGGIKPSKAPSAHCQ